MPGNNQKPTEESVYCPHCQQAYRLNNVPVSCLKCGYVFSHEKADRINSNISKTETDVKVGRSISLCLSEQEEMRKWEIGDRIGINYGIYDIKMGGMGIVYICFLPYDEPKFIIVLKTFQERFISDDNVRKLFTHEALTWVRLEEHRNIVPAYHVTRIENQPYICLEYIDGGNLSDFMTNDILDLKTGLNFAIQFCNGMEYANKKLGNCVHRDIKPQNIMITQDKVVKITDFGLMKAAGKEAKRQFYISYKGPTVMQSGPKGTLPWMSPEQFSSEEIDTRTDIYSFGIVLFQMFTHNNYPYSIFNGTQEEFIANHFKTAPFSPLSFNPKIPGTLNSLILRCLEKKPDDRFQNFTDIKDKLMNIYHEATSEEFVFEEEPNQLEASELSDKGVSLANLGSYDEALECCDKAIEINPSDDLVWNDKGFVLSELGGFNEALEYFDKAIEINPRSVEAWYNRGQVLFLLERYYEAIRCFDTALEIYPRFAKAWRVKGSVLIKLEKFDEAIKCYDKVLEISPVVSLPWNNRGFAFYKLGKLIEAIECYDKALDINPRFYVAWNNKGFALCDLGKFIEAVRCCNKALEINHRYASAWKNKGVIFGKLGKLDESIECFNKAIEIDPKYADAIKKLNESQKIKEIEQKDKKE